MASEHASLDGLLAEAVRGSVEAYREFRQHLLRHVRIEERLLLPMAERKRGSEPLPVAARLRLDHGALAALMTLLPTHGTFRAVSAVLKAHNPLEENSGKVYDQCETLAGSDASELLSNARRHSRSRCLPGSMIRRSWRQRGARSSAPATPLRCLMKPSRNDSRFHPQYQR